MSLAAQEYMDRRIATLKENVTLAQRALMNKRNDLSVVASAFQTRVAQMRAQQENQQGQQKQLLAL